MNVVKTQGITKVYTETAVPVYALNGIDLEVEEGEFTAIVGPSGCGKTTLLNIIGGLDHPTAGTVEVSNTNITDMKDGDLIKFRLENIGFVFQAYNLIPVLTAAENVEFVMQVQGIATAERNEKAQAILKEVGLEGLENRRPAEMSGGQQQRVAVARAVASRPALILADEPTANLDSKTSDELMELFTELNESHGSTFIIASHDQRVMNYAKRLIRMLDGRIVEDIDQRAA